MWKNLCWPWYSWPCSSLYLKCNLMPSLLVPCLILISLRPLLHVPCSTEVIRQALERKFTVLFMSCRIAPLALTRIVTNRGNLTAGFVVQIVYLIVTKSIYINEPNWDVRTSSTNSKTKGNSIQTTYVLSFSSWTCMNAHMLARKLYT